MSLLDWFIDDPGMDPTEKLLMHGLQRYGQFETMEKLSSSIMPDQDRDMDREYKRLSIEEKKRALGMQTSEDLDESRNNDWPLYAVTARRSLQRIPEAGFMSGKTDKLSPFFKIGRSVPNDDIPSIARRIIRAVS